MRRLPDRRLSHIEINDLDGDGVGNGADNCPLASDPFQTDSDADQLGDVCDCNSMICQLPIEVVRDQQAMHYPGQGAIVDVRNLYVTALSSRGFFAQIDPTQVPMHYGNVGIHVNFGPSAVQVGNRVDVAGFTFSFNGLEEIAAITVTRTNTGTTLPFGPISRFSDEVATYGVGPVRTTGLSADAYESMWIRTSDQVVVNANPDAPSNFSEFEILWQSATPSDYLHGLRVDDYLFNYNTVLAGKRDLGDRFTTLSGILVYVNNEHKLAPRNSTDIVPVP